MRELHVVALSEDGRSVLLATSKKASAGGFRLRLDGKLPAAMRGDLPREGETGVRETGVSPKEIQARMRAGESAQQIAEAAGVPVARVERFAGPVLSERARIIDEARAAFLSRGRLGPSLLPLGDAVQAALAETSSLRPDSIAWSARRLDSGHWLVQVSYVARARTRTGSWVLDPATRSITASDAGSAALGHRGEEPGRSVGAAAPQPVATARLPAKKKPAKKGAKKKAAPTRAAVRKAAVKAAPAKKAVKKAVAKKAAVKKAAVKKAVAKTTAVKKAVASKPAATTAPAKKAAPRPDPVKQAPAARRKAAAKPPAKKAARVQDAELETPRALRVVPPPADREPEPEPTPRRRAAGERAQVPAWADVLLGIAPRDKADG